MARRRDMLKYGGAALAAMGPPYIPIVQIEHRERRSAERYESELDENFKLKPPWFTLEALVPEDFDISQGHEILREGLEQIESASSGFEREAEFEVLYLQISELPDREYENPEQLYREPVRTYFPQRVDQHGGLRPGDLPEIEKKDLRDTYQETLMD